MMLASKLFRTTLSSAKNNRLVLSSSNSNRLASTTRYYGTSQEPRLTVRHPEFKNTQEKVDPNIKVPKNEHDDDHHGDHHHEKLALFKPEYEIPKEYDQPNGVYYLEDHHDHDAAHGGAHEAHYEEPSNEIMDDLESRYPIGDAQNYKEISDISEFNASSLIPRVNLTNTAAVDASLLKRAQDAQLLFKDELSVISKESTAAADAADVDIQDPEVDRMLNTLIQDVKEDHDIKQYLDLIQGRQKASVNEFSSSLITEADLENPDEEAIRKRIEESFKSEKATATTAATATAAGAAHKHTDDHHHHKEGEHHDDHHDDHHHHVDPDDVEDTAERGYYQNRPPNSKSPIHPIFVYGVLGIPVVYALYIARTTKKEDKKTFTQFQEDYFKYNPELKERYVELTKTNYPLSH
ncbi:hypothetical protein CYY_005107 [Polysphondylium violaceum]|uniref:Uncharacterized protein n=1 Tax=Polysphondylium violaceum TaxID=133409 RepID=A0A8J4UYU1_9MYCE|nr:hypothetical protein CYY_005107 [Polysphondylium violaceum]